MRLVRMSVVMAFLSHALLVHAFLSTLSTSNCGQLSSKMSFSPSFPPRGRHGGISLLVERHGLAKYPHKRRGSYTSLAFRHLRRNFICFRRLDADSHKCSNFSKYWLCGDFLPCSYLAVPLVPIVKDSLGFSLWATSFSHQTEKECADKNEQDHSEQIDDDGELKTLYQDGQVGFSTVKRANSSSKHGLRNVFSKEFWYVCCIEVI